MKIRTTFILIVFTLSSFIFAHPALADKKHSGSNHPPIQHGKKHGTPKKTHKEGGHKKHLFSDDWHDTLSDHQKLEVDKMHITLMKESAPIKAMIKLKKAELAILATQDAADLKAIDQKINEILDLKRQKIQKRFHHIAEMRGILSPEQRLSYDMMIIGRAMKPKK